jgi:hypothetical protein
LLNALLRSFPVLNNCQKLVQSVQSLQGTARSKL